MPCKKPVFEVQAKGVVALMERLVYSTKMDGLISSSA